MTSAEILSNVFNNGIKPDSIISVSEWADANRVEQNRFKKHSPRFFYPVASGFASLSPWVFESGLPYLSQTASSEPGKFRTSRTPYLKDIMDALSPSSSYEKIVFMKGSQIGGTEAGNNWIGYMIDQAPGPMLVVQPTVEMGKRWSKGRLAPLIEDTLCLRNILWFFMKEFFYE